MKKRISSFSVHQTSKTFAVISFVLSALVGIPVGIYQLLNAADKMEAIVWFLLPFFYIALTYLMTALWTSIYNWISDFVGGIEVTVSDTDFTQPK